MNNIISTLIFSHPFIILLFLAFGKHIRNNWKSTHNPNWNETQIWKKHSRTHSQNQIHLGPNAIAILHTQTRIFKHTHTHNKNPNYMYNKQQPYDDEPTNQNQPNIHCWHIAIVLPKSLFHRDTTAKKKQFATYN